MAGKPRRNSKRLSREEQEDADLYDMVKETSDRDVAALKNIVFKNTDNPNISTTIANKHKKLKNRIYENQIIFIKGPAGTGKTFSALKHSLGILQKDPDINKLLIAKPIVEAGDESLGFLPGDKHEKISPYLSSFYSNISKIVDRSSDKMLCEKFIEPKIIAYERGSTFDGCVAILDEAQNLTVSGLKLFISRLGENAKMIIMGDTDQVDIKLREGQVSGLEDAFQRFKGVDGVSFHEFTEDDIVRSKILVDVMKRYNSQ